MKYIIRAKFILRTTFNYLNNTDGHILGIDMCSRAVYTPIQSTITIHECNIIMLYKDIKYCSVHIRPVEYWKQYHDEYYHWFHFFVDPFMLYHPLSPDLSKYNRIYISRYLLNLTNEHDIIQYHLLNKQNKYPDIYFDLSIAYMGFQLK